MRVCVQRTGVFPPLNFFFIFFVGMEVAMETYRDVKVDFAVCRARN